MTKHKPRIYFCLLVYLMVWVGNTQAAPLLLMIVGHSHKAFWNYRGYAPQLILHHPGHHDEHEPTALTLSARKHDMLDHVLAAVTGEVDHEDIVLQIPGQRQHALTSIRGVEVGKSLASPATVAVLPCFAVLATVPLLAQPPPKIDLLLLHIRTTVLLN